MFWTWEAGTCIPDALPPNHLGGAFNQTLASFPSTAYYPYRSLPLCFPSLALTSFFSLSIAFVLLHFKLGISFCNGNGCFTHYVQICHFVSWLILGEK
ncbi:hypothetical protein HRI_001527500 [Hibiscus trionum]|uniref:Uncharacterized protein n=1 Tax=Hibiscus trionum TaxID=183268 RepID=A0A9W7HKL5_HIBTR|nr:hypothetical protein HRI_001527500 [Hibiscus trionum]